MPRDDTAVRILEADPDALEGVECRGRHFRPSLLRPVPGAHQELVDVLLDPGRRRLVRPVRTARHDAAPILRERPRLRRADVRSLRDGGVCHGARHGGAETVTRGVLAQRHVGVDAVAAQVVRWAVIGGLLAWLRAVLYPLMVMDRDPPPHRGRGGRLEGRGQDVDLLVDVRPHALL